MNDQIFKTNNTQYMDKMSTMMNVGQTKSGAFRVVGRDANEELQTDRVEKLLHGPKNEDTPTDTVVPFTPVGAEYDLKSLFNMYGLHYEGFVYFVNSKVVARQRAKTGIDYTEDIDVATRKEIYNLVDDYLKVVGIPTERSKIIMEHMNQYLYKDATTARAIITQSIKQKLQEDGRIPGNNVDLIEFIVDAMIDKDSEFLALESEKEYLDFGEKIRVDVIIAYLNVYYNLKRIPVPHREAFLGAINVLSLDSIMQEVEKYEKK